ncbi:unnamed protein product [Mycena citricolor]|uniref:Major facilitator superfamily (MFS) profile domain-containing protein n=1 Tax=Mycena citricolor TaxID=2018698 RepID=A0AAD2GTN8_9AGAR|nr:unnamed protein product [Mycena citricolor]CAK5261952.1 unnamed protein product [Mycena citricolor]
MPAAAGTGGGINNGSLLWAMVMSAFAAFGGILYGYDTGTIGGALAMVDWLETFGAHDSTGVLGLESNGYYVKTSNKSLVVSILSAGTFFGALVAYPMGDIVGRKWGIIASCCVFSLGVGLQLDTQWATFIVGRFIGGIGVGLVSVLVPMYQSECAPKQIRGLIVGLYQFAITIGALLAAIVSNATKNRADHNAWRIPIALQFAWALILSGGMAMLPESPRYLMYKNRVPEARKSMARLASAPEDSEIVSAEVREIELALAAEANIGNASYLDCFRGGEYKNGFRTWTGILIQGWQQLTGINFIFYYGTTFFSSAGIKNPFIITIITDVVNSVMTLFGVQLIDRIGRRRLLLIGAAGMLVSQYIVAIVGVTAGQATASGAVNLAAQRVLIAFVCFYISFFAISWGPVTWVVVGEIFSLNLRAKSMSLAVASNWLWNFGIGYATPYLVDPSTKGQPNGVATAGLGVKVFFIWGSTCVGCLIFTYFFVPETKGLSLEQVDLLYKNSTIRGSVKYREHMLDADASYTGKSQTEHVEKV